MSLQMHSRFEIKDNSPDMLLFWALIENVKLRTVSEIPNCQFPLDIISISRHMRYEIWDRRGIPRKSHKIVLIKSYPVIRALDIGNPFSGRFISRGNFINVVRNCAVLLPFTTTWPGDIPPHFTKVQHFFFSKKLIRRKELCKL